MFNTKLNSPSGPNKRITDTGALIDPTLDAIGGFSQVAEAADRVNKGYKAKKKAKAAATRQAKLDKRADIKFDQQQADRQTRLDRASVLDARADTVFAQAQEDRKSTERDEVFADRMATALRDINKKQRAISQGALRGTSLQLETEKAVTSLMTEFPEYSSELNKGFKEFGVSHLTLGEIEDEKSEQDNIREAREAAKTSAIKTAYDRGMADDDTPEYEAVAIGQQISSTEAIVEQQRERQRIANENRRLSNSEREAELASSNRELRKASLSASRTMMGTVTSGFVSKMGKVNDPEAFRLLQQSAPAELAKLEEIRFELHEMSGYDKDSMASIDKNIEHQKKFIVDMTTGDLSQAKRQATHLANIKNNAKVSFFEAYPVMLELEVRPRALSEPFLEGSAVLLSNNKRLTDGLADMVSGLGDSSDANYMRKVLDPNIKATDANIAPDIAKGIVQKDIYQQQTALRNVLQPSDSYPVEEALPEFMDAHLDLVQVMDNTLGGGTRDSLKSIKSASGVLFNPGVVGGLNAGIANSATKVQATELMKFNRKLADRTLRSLLDNSEAHGNFDVSFDEKTGSFKTKFSEKRVADNVSSAQRFGSPLIGLIGREEGLAAAENFGPSSRDEEVVESLNNALEFLVRTVEHEKELPNSLQESEYRKAYATGDFSAFLKKEETEDE